MLRLSVLPVMKRVEEAMESAPTSEIAEEYLNGMSAKAA